MTNKINDIDVSECPLYDKNTGCYHTFNGECVKDSCALYLWLLKHKRLQQENEELKNRLKILDDEEFVYEVTEIEYNNFKKMNKYKQALEEIREIAKFNQFYNPEKLIINGDIGQIQNLKMTEIYNKINEVLNDRD